MKIRRKRALFINTRAHIIIVIPEISMSMLFYKYMKNLIDIEYRCYMLNIEIHIVTDYKKHIYVSNASFCFSLVFFIIIIIIIIMYVIVEK